MKTVQLHGGKLKAASYDEKEQRLELEFVDGKRRAFKAVQREVFNRLCAAPNPASFFEDRIADEYPQEALGTQGTQTARKRLDDLFG
jgi:inorganic triphosphatase YgiF